MELVRMSQLLTIQSLLYSKCLQVSSYLRFTMIELAYLCNISENCDIARMDDSPASRYRDFLERFLLIISGFPLKSIKFIWETKLTAYASVILTVSAGDILP